jgi:hypothetical protein
MYTSRTCDEFDKTVAIVWPRVFSSTGVQGIYSKAFSDISTQISVS